MKRSLKWLCAALSGLFIASLSSIQYAEARQLLTMDYQNAHFNPGHVVDLKKDFAKGYPHIPLHNMDLISVSVEAKTWRGLGEAYIVEGRTTSDWVQVFGTPEDWNNPSAHSYERIHFDAPHFTSHGPWDLNLLNDHFRLRKVTIEVDGGHHPHPPAPHPPAPQPPHPPFPPHPPGHPPGYPPTHPGAFVDLVCESHGPHPVYCHAGFEVSYVEILQQHSPPHSCRPSQTFYPNRQGMTVSHGCQGLFRVHRRR